MGVGGSCRPRSKAMWDSFQSEITPLSPPTPGDRPTGVLPVASADPASLKTLVIKGNRASGRGRCSSRPPSEGRRLHGPCPGLAPDAGISTMATWSSGGVRRRPPCSPSVWDQEASLLTDTQGGAEAWVRSHSRSCGLTSRSGPDQRRGRGLPGPPFCHLCNGCDCVCPALSRQSEEKGGGKAV